MDVSIIMINYNTMELTKNAISSLREKTKGIEYEIFLVDNNSKDGSQEYFSTLQMDNFKYIQSGDNLGFGRANNLAYLKTKGRYIFLLNTDTLLINNAVKIMFDVMEKNKKIGISGGNLYDLEMKPAHSFGRKIYSINSHIKEEIISILKIFFKKEKRLNKNLKRNDFNYTDKNMEVGYITGADMMIKRECIEKVRFFDSEFFMYFEETELTYRIKKMGYKVLSIPEAKIIHLEGKSTKFKEQKVKMFNESKFKYFEKVYGKKQKWLIYSISQFSNYIKYLLSFDKNHLKIIKINKEIRKKWDQE